MCVCERERWRLSVCGGVCVRVCVFGCVCERERHMESLCVGGVSACVCVCACVCVAGSSVADVI